MLTSQIARGRVSLTDMVAIQMNQHSLLFAALRQGLLALQPKAQSQWSVAKGVQGESSCAWLTCCHWPSAVRRRPLPFSRPLVSGTATRSAAPRPPATLRPGMHVSLRHSPAWPSPVLTPQQVPIAHTHCVDAYRTNTLGVSNECCRSSSCFCRASPHTLASQQRTVHGQW